MISLISLSHLAYGKAFTFAECVFGVGPNFRLQVVLSAQVISKFLLVSLLKDTVVRLFSNKYFSELFA